MIQYKYGKEMRRMKVYICQICGKKFTGRKKKYCSQDCSDEARRIRNRERWREANPEWDKDINKVCEWCGKEFTVPARNAHIARFCSEECKQTRYSREVRGHGPAEEYLKERRKQAEERQVEVERERVFRALRTVLVKIIKLKEEEERIKELTRTCEECGKIFYDPHPLTLTCSKKCSRRRQNRVSKYYDKTRINKRNLVDKDISLEKLYKRDKGICYLCGERCDYNDKVITKEGYYIVGETYPSIDHVKPLSKGGKHSWNNVRLAHHSCNTIKRDNDIRNISRH